MTKSMTSKRRGARSARLGAVALVLRRGDRDRVDRARGSAAGQVELDGAAGDADCARWDGECRRRREDLCGRWCHTR